MVIQVFMLFVRLPVKSRLSVVSFLGGSKVIQGFSTDRGCYL